MRILIQKASMVATREGIRRDADVLIDNGKIAAVGKADTTATIDTIIEGKGKLVMPGLVNTHTHVAMSIVRGHTEQVNLSGFLKRQADLRTTLSDKDVYLAALVGCAEMIHAGVSGFVDMYGFTKSVASAANESGLRAMLGYSTNSRAKTIEEEVATSEDVLHFVRSLGNPLVSFTVAPHSIYRAKKELLEALKKLADEHGLFMQIHIAETKDDQNDAQANGHRSPFVYLDSIGCLDARSILAHCVWVSEDDLDLISQRASIVAHSPVSNAKISSGIAPLIRMLEKGVKVTFGTDGPATNNNLSVFRTLNFAALVHTVTKVTNQAFPSAEALLDIVTRKTPEYLGFNSGEISVGKDADLILVDLTAPALQPVSPENILANLVFSCPEVTGMIVGGKPVMLDRKILTFDEAGAVAQLNELAPRVIAALK